MVHKTHATLVAALLSLLALPAPSTRADGIARTAVLTAHTFLKTPKRGRDVLGYVHFGAKYRGHSYKETRFVAQGGKRVPGHFALIYKFAWERDGETEVAFLCNARGQVYDVRVVKSNGLLSRPFVLANAAVKVLGNLLIAACKDKMKADERKVVQRFVDRADSKGMLTWALKFQQAFGR